MMNNQEPVDLSTIERELRRITDGIASLAAIITFIAVVGVGFFLMAMTEERPITGWVPVAIFFFGLFLGGIVSRSIQNRR
jgi:hypothetical protein